MSWEHEYDILSDEELGIYDGPMPQSLSVIGADYDGLDFAFDGGTLTFRVTADDYVQTGGTDAAQFGNIIDWIRHIFERPEPRTRDEARRMAEDEEATARLARQLEQGAVSAQSPGSYNEPGDHGAQAAAGMLGRTAEIAEGRAAYYRGRQQTLPN